MLETHNLSKNFGSIRAVQQMNLQIPEGSVFGILGPNGSGKSTTLGMVLGVVTPSEGSFSWFGKGDDHHVRREIGAILERPIFYPAFTAVQNLKVTAKIKGVGQERIDECLKLVGLFDRRHSKFKTYSLGMKQRLAIAAAMLPDPKVLILDEPTNGLDPTGIAEIRELIKDIARGGKTIVLASHLLDEVQKVCTEFCVLRSGKLIYQGPVSETGESLQRTTVDLAAGDQALDEVLKRIDLVESFTKMPDGHYRAEVAGECTAADLNKVLFDQGIVLSYLHTHRQSLEEKFLEILKNQA